MGTCPLCLDPPRRLQAPISRSAIQVATQAPSRLSGGGAAPPEFPWATLTDIKGGAQLVRASRLRGARGFRLSSSWERPARGLAQQALRSAREGL